MAGSKGLPYKLLLFPLVALVGIMLVFWPSAPHERFPQGDAGFNQRRVEPLGKPVEGVVKRRDAGGGGGGGGGVGIPTGGRHEEVHHDDAHVKESVGADEAVPRGEPDVERRQATHHDGAHEEAAREAQGGAVDCFFVAPAQETDSNIGGYFGQVQGATENGKPLYYRPPGAWARTSAYLGRRQDGHWVVTHTREEIASTFSLMATLDAPEWPHESAAGWHEGVPLTTQYVEARHGECYDVVPLPKTAKATAENKVPVANGTDFLADYPLGEMQNQPDRYQYPAANRFVTYPFDFEQQVPHAVIAEMPKVVLFPGLVSDEDCDAIVEVATHSIRRSKVVDAEKGKTKGDKVDNVRTSYQTWLDARHHAVARLMDNIYAVTGFKRGDSEALQVLRYEEGQKYNAHVDYFSAARYGKMDQNRAVTCFIYLNTVEEGGWTWFPKANGGDASDGGRSLIKCKGGLRTIPKRGTVACFYDMRPDGSLDEFSLHAGCPVIKGEKWGGTLWLHQSTP